MDIQDKVVIITGASSGIGEATARLLASKGAKVALAARSLDKLEALADELPGSFVAPVDMTDEASIKEMVANVVAHYGRVDILVNNAGRGSGWAPLERLDLDEFRKLMELNVYGPVIAMQQVIPVMRQQGGGVIVNIGSGTVHRPMDGGSLYPGTKVLLTHVSRVARLELEKDGIVVSVLHPYITATNFFDAIDRRANERETLSPELMKSADSPEKVADAVLDIIGSGAEETSLSPRR